MTKTTRILRYLPLSDNVRGSLWLTSMPGRFEKLTVFLAAADAVEATGILCLATEQEIESKSPEYFHARRADCLSLPVRDYPIRECHELCVSGLAHAGFRFGLPQDRAGFARLIIEICADLCQGKRMIIHCAAGIGRTGLVAHQVLMALGTNPSQAHEQVKRAGSGPESDMQKDFCQTPVALFQRP
jgi:hypothetical protein